MLARKVETRKFHATDVRNARAVIASTVGMLTEGPAVYVMILFYSGLVPLRCKAFYVVWNSRLRSEALT